MEEKRDKKYYNLYRIGLRLSFGFALIKMLLITINNFKWKNLESFIREIINSDIVSIFLFAIPSAIIIIMYFMAKGKIKVDLQNKTFYKEYIQLEGYIQTLIGFFIAILSIIPLENAPQDKPFSLGLVAYPISLALVTSILGWYFGSDLVQPKEDKEFINDLNEDVLTLKKNINRLSTVLNDTKNKFKKTSDDFASNLIGLFTKQEETIKAYEASLSSLNQSKDDYRKQITETLISFKDDFKDFSSEVERSTLSLNNKVFRIQEKNQNKQLQSVEVFFNKLNKKIDAETDKIQFFNNALDEYLKSTTNIFSDLNTNISNYLKNTDILNNITTTNIEKTNATLISIDNEFKNIKNEIHNIKKTILDDLYSNHKLRNDITEINESIKNLKPNKYITFSFSLSNWFKRNKK